MDFPDYSQILDIAPDAGAREVRLAYRRLARRYHPDRNAEAGAEQRFKEITWAYAQWKRDLGQAGGAHAPPVALLTAPRAQAPAWQAWLRDAYSSASRRYVQYRQLQRERQSVEAATLAEFEILLRHRSPFPTPSPEVLENLYAPETQPAPRGRVHGRWSAGVAGLAGILLVWLSVHGSAPLIARIKTSPQPLQVAVLDAAPQDYVARAALMPPLGGSMIDAVAIPGLAPLSRAQERLNLFSFPPRAYLPDQARPAVRYPATLPLMLVRVGDDLLPPDGPLHDGMPLGAAEELDGTLEALAVQALEGENDTQEAVPRAADLPQVAQAETAGSAAPENVPLTRRLQACEALLAANQLTQGPGGNALDCYRRVLALDPANVQAQAGLKTLSERFIAWAEKALHEQNPVKVKRYLERLEQVDPKSPALADLRRRMATLQAAPAAARPPAQATESPPLSLQSQPKRATVCATCNCSQLLLQLSMGVQPLSGEEKAFLQSQCR